MEDQLKQFLMFLGSIFGIIFIAIWAVCFTIIAVQFSAVYSAKANLEIAKIEAQMPAKKGCEG